MSYAEKLKDPRWQKKRLEILQRDEWTCRYCGDKETTLHVHHDFYIPGEEPWEADEYFLITLCSDCHELVHAGKTKLETYLIGCMICRMMIMGQDIKMFARHIREFER